jgi:hypothetical protein
MRIGNRLFGPLLAVTAAALLLTGLAQGAGDKLTKPAGKLELKDGKAEVQSKLAADDPKDRVRADCYCKVYTIKLEKGGKYQFDCISTNVFDNFMRIEDAKGEQLAEDDDSGGDLNARIIFDCKEAGEYRIIVTSYAPGDTGEFTLKAEKK